MLSKRKLLVSVGASLVTILAALAAVLYHHSHLEKGGDTLESSAVPGVPIHDLTKAEAIAIANRHFGREDQAGCFAEERGDYFFVAPPLKRRNDLNAKGIYVNKRTKEVVAVPPDMPKDSRR